MTHNEILNAIYEDPFVIEKLNEHEQTHEICVTAIKRNPYALDCIKNKTEELCMIAATIDPFTTTLIRDK